MARPQKEGLDYFPHDTDAANDEKVEALRALHGNDGYAFYFILLERIYRTTNAEFDTSKPAVLAALINKIGVCADKFYSMLETAFDTGCLSRTEYETRSVLTSNGIKKRAGEVGVMREKWRKKKVFPGVIHPVFPRENAEVTPERKEKKIKEKESKESTPPYAEIVSYLNAATGASYRHTGGKTQEKILARWNDGFRLPDFQSVIDKKASQWLHDPTMSKFLRPETLFGPKFEGYLQEKQPVKSAQTVATETYMEQLERQHREQQEAGAREPTVT